MTNDEPQFGIDDCTCIPFTRQTNPSRYLNRPTDTVDMISGWERGRDCPHHVPAVPVSSPPPDRTALRDRGAKAEALLLRFTAEAHRRKWNYDRGLDDDGRPIKSEAFDALHRLGDEMNAELHKLRAVPAAPPPTIRAAVYRQLVIEALYEARRPGLGSMTEAEAVAHMADAVVTALLPPAVRSSAPAGDEDCERCEGSGLDPDAYFRNGDTWTHAPCSECQPEDDETAQRRLAAEAQQPDTETQACAHSDGCDGECPCPPSCGCCTVTAAPGTEMPNTARAAVYREVADRLTTDAHGMQPDWARIYKRDAAVKVREWADRLDGEGRQDEPSDGIAVSRTHSEP